MRTHVYYLGSATVFALVAAGHLSRLITSWPLTIGSWPVPLWVSIVGVLIPGTLAICGLRLARSTR